MNGLGDIQLHRVHTVRSARISEGHNRKQTVIVISIVSEIITKTFFKKKNAGVITSSIIIEAHNARQCHSTSANQASNS